MTIVGDERALYESVWTMSAYADHAPGEQYLPLFQQMIRDHPPSSRWDCRATNTVLDAGTGSGKGALALVGAGFSVTACDLTADGLVPEAKALPFVPVCLWGDVLAACGRHEWVYCTDVLEHIPPVFASLVVHRLIQCCRSGAFFSISLVPDAFGKWVGRPLHQTVLPYGHWRDTLNELGTVIDARDLGHTGVYLVRPR